MFAKQWPFLPGLFAGEAFTKQRLLKRIHQKRLLKRIHQTLRFSKRIQSRARQMDARSTADTGYQPD